MEATNHGRRICSDGSLSQASRLQVISSPPRPQPFVLVHLSVWSVTVGPDLLSVQCTISNVPAQVKVHEPSVICWHMLKWLLMLLLCAISFFKILHSSSLSLNCTYFGQFIIRKIQYYTFSSQSLTLPRLQQFSMPTDGSNLALYGEKNF